MAFENLPEGWKEHSLEDFVNFTKGFAFKSKDYQKSGRRIVKVSNFTVDSIDVNDCVYIDESRSAEFEKHTLKTNDVVIATVGSWPGSPSVVGKIIRVPQQANDSFLNQNAVNVDVKEGFDKKFLYYLLKNYHFKSYIESTARGSANQASITLDSIKKYHFDCPPLTQQQKIASILGALDDKIELNNQMHQTLEMMARALFKSWFVDFEPFQDGEFEESELGLIPKEWRVGTIEEASVNHNRLRKPISKMEREKIQGSYPYYGAASAIDFLDFYKFDGVYLLMAEDGTVMNDAGNPTLQYVQGRFSVSNHAHILTGANAVSTEFLYLFLSSFQIKPFVTGSVQLKINKKNLNSIPLIIPSDEVLDEFNAQIKPMFEQVLSNELQSKTLSVMRDDLLSKLMSGEVAV